MANRMLDDATVVNEECATLDELLQTPARVDAGTPPPRPSTVVGRLLGFADPFLALVTYPGQTGDAAAQARVAIDLDERHIGDDVILNFEDGDWEKPIVIARLRRPSAWPFADTPPAVQVEADGRRLRVDAAEEITLRCGQASITLTRAGKVLIKGTYVVSQSSGVNRIKGGSVQLN